MRFHWLGASKEKVDRSVGVLLPSDLCVPCLLCVLWCMPGIIMRICVRRDHTDYYFCPDLTGLSFIFLVCYGLVKLSLTFSQFFLFGCVLIFIVLLALVIAVLLYLSFLIFLIFHCSSSSFIPYLPSVIPAVLVRY